MTTAGLLRAAAAGGVIYFAVVVAFGWFASAAIEMRAHPFVVERVLLTRPIPPDDPLPESVVRAEVENMCSHCNPRRFGVSATRTWETDVAWRMYVGAVQDLFIPLAVLLAGNTCMLLLVGMAARTRAPGSYSLVAVALLVVASHLIVLAAYVFAPAVFYRVVLWHSDAAMRGSFVWFGILGVGFLDGVSTRPPLATAIANGSRRLLRRAG